MHARLGIVRENECRDSMVAITLRRDVAQETGQLLLERYQSSATGPLGPVTRHTPPPIRSCIYRNVSLDCSEQPLWSAHFVEPVGGGGRPITVCPSRSAPPFEDLHRLGGPGPPGKILSDGEVCGTVFPDPRHNPIRICAKGFGKRGNGGKVLTHQNGPIMMKWSIWVILERLQVFLLTSSFFSTDRFVSSPHNARYTTPVLPGKLPSSDTLD